MQETQMALAIEQPKHGAHHERMDHRVGQDKRTQKKQARNAQRYLQHSHTAGYHITKLARMHTAARSHRWIPPLCPTLFAKSRH